VALHGEDAGGDVEALDCAARGGAEEGGGDGRQVGEDIFVHLVDVLWGGGWGVSAGKGAYGGGGKTYQLFLPKKLFAFLGEVYSADTDFPSSIHAIAALNLAAQRAPNDLVTVAYADDADSVLC